MTIKLIKILKRVQYLHFKPFSFCNLFWTTPLHHDEWVLMANSRASRLKYSSSVLDHSYLGPGLWPAQRSCTATHHNSDNNRRSSSSTTHTHSQVVDVVLSRLVKLSVWHLQVAGESRILEEEEEEKTRGGSFLNSNTGAFTATIWCAEPLTCW